MYDLLFLVLLCLISPKVLAGTVYQFPSSLNVKSGDTVTMHCQMNEVQSLCHTVAWVRVHPESGGIDILQDTNIPRQTKDQVCWASIINATVQDSGTYYCIATDREHMHLGNGTAVTIQADSTTMPSIDIMAFTSHDNHDSTLTLQCTVSGFSPSQVNIYWFIGSRKENGQTFLVWDEGEANTVKTLNYVAISDKGWITGIESTCIVKLAGRTYNKTMHHYDIYESCYPVISVNRIFAIVSALLFFTASLILAHRF